MEYSGIIIILPCLDPKMVLLTSAIFQSPLLGLCVFQDVVDNEYHGYNQ